MTEIVSLDLHAPDPEVIVRAAGVLRAGGIIVYPTETVYGIGADALNDAAVKKVAAVKRRGDGKPILVVVDERAGVERLVQEIPADANRLMEAFWPGPLTLVFRARPGIPSAITQGTGTVGIRIPSSVVARRIAAAAGVPVTSTSANISGEPAPASAAGIRETLGNGVDLIVDAGALPPSMASTVVDVSGDVPVLAREGVISELRLRRIVPALRRSAG